MRHLLFVAVFALSVPLVAQNQNVGIGTSTPDSSAMLDIQSSDKGILVPRLSTAERGAINNPATGLLVYDSDLNSFYFYDGTQWTQMIAAEIDPQVGANDTNHLARWDGSALVKSNLQDIGGALVALDTVGSVPVSGPGSRLMWIPENRAFRSGEVTGAEWDSTNIGDWSFIGGGIDNIASGDGSFIGGGQNDTATGFLSFIGGGRKNQASWDFSFIGGGISNHASGFASAIVGGQLNEASANSSYIGGGTNNSAAGVQSCVSGGFNNITSDVNSATAGGQFNNALGGASFVGGGSNDTASGSFSFIGGGSENISSGVLSFIGGGLRDTASGDRSYVGGGNLNHASGFSSAIVGGQINQASANSSFIGGGSLNIASGVTSFIGGGANLKAKSYAEAVFGTYNTDYTPDSETLFDPDDRLFVIGNGTSENSRSDAVTVLKNGKVGIGTSSPLAILAVNQSANLLASLESSSSVGTWLGLGNSSTGGTWFQLISTGSGNGQGPGKLLFTTGSILGAASMIMTLESTTKNVGIGTASPSEKLHVVGNICYTGTSAACSDIRYKEHFQQIPDALQKITTLNGVYYHWNQEAFPDKDFTSDRQIGVIAQEVEALFPEMVLTDRDGYKSVDYSRLTPVLIEAIKEQQAEIEELKRHVAGTMHYENSVRSLQEEIKELKAILLSDVNQTTRAE